MRRAALALLLALWPATARADAPPASTGIQAALRTAGWALPFGKLSGDGAKLSDAAKGAFPLAIDMGFKPFEHMLVGIYVGFHPLMLGKAYTAAACKYATCFGNDVRLGLQGQLHMRPMNRLSPWLGAGVGIESMTITKESTFTDDNSLSQGGTVSLQGPELVFSGGTDWRVSEAFGVGPFVQWSMGRFSTVASRKFSGESKVDSIGLPDLHFWLAFGVRVVLFP